MGFNFKIITAFFSVARLRTKHMTQKNAKCALLPQSKRVIYLFLRISKAFKKVQKLRLSAVELKKKKCNS